jgi:sugar/nucleoside kinase (ribokinase family)
MTGAGRPPRLLTVGSIVADVRIAVPHLPAQGGDVIGSNATISAGGGFNILSAAARTGLPAAFAGRHGTGPYGDRIRSDLAAEGIRMLQLPMLEADSGFCIVLVEPDGERTFVTSPGVEAAKGIVSLDDVRVTTGDTVFVSGYDLSYPDLGPAICRWSATMPDDIRLVVDPGPLVAEIPAVVFDGVLKRVDVLTLNRREAGLLTGETDVSKAALSALARLKPGALVIVRDGPHGCLLAGSGIPGGVRHIAAPRVEMIDSTGAGDTHTGVFIAATALGHDAIAAAIRANAAAALSVTRKGPATAPGKEELDAFLAAVS